MSTTRCCRTRCSCGHIHLSVGPVTIRMDEDTLHAAWHTVGDALWALKQPAPERTEPEAAERGWKQ